jgi:hypothetical protein
MTTVRNIGTPAMLLAAYALFRKRMLRWGATDEEVRRPFPRPDLIPGGKRRSVMAVSLDAPPSQVWPWLTQMGYDKGGARRVHPEWQDVAIGDRVTGADVPCFEIAALEAEQLLALRTTPIPGLFGQLTKNPSIWAFELVPAERARTRLIVSVYERPHWPEVILYFAFWEPAHWVMQMRQFQNLQRRIAQCGSAFADRDPAERSAFMRLFYRDRQPTWFGHVNSQLFCWWARLGLPPRFLVALEVPDRISGRKLQDAVLTPTVQGQRYIVSMFGTISDWVHNLEAAHGNAMIYHGRPERVRLVPVPPEGRAPILQEYVRVASSGRKHFPLPVDAPLADFAAIAALYPVYRIEATQ